MQEGEREKVKGKRERGKGEREKGKGKRERGKGKEKTFNPYPLTPSGFASRSWGKPPRPRWLTFSPNQIPV
ncbi:hypothetical protein VF11_31605 [Nostoc linckia z14]|nr:hypothetical protein VF11_31605 [Nostoc linckia z14]